MIPVREEWPKSTAELADIVRREEKVICGGSGPYSVPTPYREAIGIQAMQRLDQRGPDETKLDFSGIDESSLPDPENFVHIKLNELATIIELSAADMVVHVQAGMNIGRLQDELAEQDLCIPIPYQSSQEQLEFDAGMWLVGSERLEKLIGFDLPHGNESRHGSWRDWILGMTVVLADGTIAKAGSSVVKSVAGYDIHRFLVGARGTLGIVTELTLRVLPRQALKPCPVVFSERMRKGEGPALFDAKIGVQRVARSDFGAALDAFGDRALAWEPEAGIVWVDLAHDDSYPSWPGSWTVRRNCGDTNLEITDPTQIKLMKRAKDIFDPTHKLNPGEMGIF